MKKILYCASNMTHINNFHLPYINALKGDGYSVSVMACGEGADYNIPFEKRIFSTKNLKCRKMIKKIISEGGFDAVILNTSLAAYHIRKALPKRNRPRVINIVHGYLFPRRLRGIRDRLLLFAEKTLRKKTDKILVMNKEDFEIADKYRLSSASPVMTLGMGAVCGGRELSRERIRDELLANDKFVISFVGELSKRKNQGLLIRALKAVKERVTNAVLWLIGEGDMRGELSGLARRLGLSDSVVFLGRRDNPCDFIRASDVYASAAKIEGMPFNIIEALGTGTPIVASDIKGHRDLMEEDAWLLYPEGDLSALADKILLLGGGAEYDRKRAAEVYAEYSFEKVFNKTYAAITEALVGE